MTPASAFVYAALVAIVLVVAGVVYVKLTTIARLRSQNDRIADLVRMVEEGKASPAAKLTDDMTELREMVYDGLEKMEALMVETRRLDGRARYAVTRHLRRLEELGIDPSDRVADAGHDLRILDGGLSDPEGVQPVHPEVESPEAEPEDPKSWLRAAQRHKYGA